MKIKCSFLFYVVFIFLFDFSSFFIYIYKLQDFHYRRESLSNGHTFCCCYHPLSLNNKTHQQIFLLSGGRGGERRATVRGIGMCTFPTVRSISQRVRAKPIANHGNGFPSREKLQKFCLTLGVVVSRATVLCAHLLGWSEMRIPYWFISSPDVCPEKMIIKLI